MRVLKAGLWVIAKHFPVYPHNVADTALQQFDNNLDWTHRQGILLKITHRFYRPSTVDFCQPNQQPGCDRGAMTTDAFFCNLNQCRSWIYPTVVLLPRILRKIQADQAKAPILAPHCKGETMASTTTSTTIGIYSAPHR